MVPKASKRFENSEKYNLVLEIAILYLKSYILPVIFSNSFLIIRIY